MTAVGKILAFINLVFSFVVGGLVMVAFVTRANWEDYSKKLQATNDVLGADLKQTAAEKEKLQNELAELKQSMRNAVLALAKGNDQAAQELLKRGAVEVVKQAAADRENAERERDEAKAALGTIEQAAVKGNADTAAAQKAAEARKDQIKELENNITQLRADNQKLIVEANNERRERIRAQVAQKTLERANESLEDQVRELAKDLARSKAGRGTTTTAGRKRGVENPPPDDVEGRILRVDRGSDLVRISVGSDAGLQPGHTLKVFRLDRVPENSKYLGEIEIVSARPHEAVGRPVRRTAYEMREGDRVASRIGLGGS